MDLDVIVFYVKKWNVSYCKKKIIKYLIAFNVVVLV